MHRALRALLASFATTLAIGFSHPVEAQENPVYIDDSPLAWEMLQQARDQSRDNLGEAVRLYQELLDDFTDKLVPITAESTDHYAAVRQLVLKDLLSNPQLLRRYQLIESSVAERLLADGDINKLSLTHSMTEAGLKGLLLRSQAALEEGRFYDALSWLDEVARHSLLDNERSLHCWSMRAIAAHFLGDEVLLETAQNELMLMGPAGERAVDALAQIVQHRREGAWHVGLHPGSEGHVVDLSDLVPEAIWSVSLQEGLASRRDEVPPTSFPRRSIGTTPASRFRTAAATVADQSVFINEGHRIMAYDRYTGHPNWESPFRDSPLMAGFTPEPEGAADLNLIAIAGDALVTLTGHAAGESRTGDGKVVCLDARTGERRWSRSLHLIGGDPDHEGLFPHGEPIILHDTVYVLARRVNRQLLSSCYVVALDLATGNLRWSRHIASSAGLRRSSRPFSSLERRDGDLYVATPLGAVARLNAQTGLVKWLRTQRVPVMTTQMLMSAQPWEISAPVVTADRVIAFHPDFQRVGIYDRERGDLLQTIDVSTVAGWNGPRYLLADEHNLYAIGRTIRTLSLDDLSFVLWRLPGDPTSFVDDTTIEAPREFPPLEGRVQLVNGALVAPTSDGVKLIDSNTGTILRNLTHETTGNVLAIDSEIMVAGSERLDAYMSFNRAEQMLRKRIVASPDDPDAALALLRLALRVDDIPLALESAELTVQATKMEPTSSRSLVAQQELFSLLLESARNDRGPGEPNTSLFATIESIADGPSQQLEYLLAKGDWQARHDLTQAIDAYHKLLSDSALAAQWRIQDGIIRTGADWALHRITALTMLHGVGAYASLEQAAGAELRRLEDQTSLDPTALESLVARYPLSTAAVRAARRGAELYIARHQPRRAIQLLLQAYRNNPRAATAVELVPTALTMLDAVGWDGLTIDVLSAIQRDHANLQITVDGERTSVDAMLARLTPPPPRHPRVGVPGEAFDELKEAQLIRPYSGSGASATASASRLHDRVLLYRPGGIQSLAAKNLTPMWNVPTNVTSAPQLLGSDNEGMLLWMGGASAEPWAVMLSPDDGSTIWTSPTLAKVLQNPIAPLERRGGQEQMPGGMPLNIDETLAVMGTDQLIMVRRTGDLAAFDLRDGTQAQWVVEDVLYRVHHVLLTEHSLVLAGMELRAVAGASLPTPSPLVLILNPDTGEVLHRIHPFGDGGVRWLTAGPLGQLIFGTDTGIEAVGMFSGRRQWANNSTDGLDTDDGWRVSDQLVVHGTSLGLRTLNPRTGELSPPFATTLIGSWDPRGFRELIVQDDRFYARFDERVLRYKLNGEIIGADTVPEEREYHWLLPAEGRLVLISAQRIQQRRRRIGLNTSYSYRIYVLSENCAVLSDTASLEAQNAPVTDAMLIDGTLLLATDVDTLAISMPSR